MAAGGYEVEFSRETKTVNVYTGRRGGEREIGLL